MSVYCELVFVSRLMLFGYCKSVSVSRLVWDGHYVGTCNKKAPFGAFYNS